MVSAQNRQLLLPPMVYSTVALNGVTPPGLSVQLTVWPSTTPVVCVTGPGKLTLSCTSTPVVGSWDRSTEPDIVTRSPARWNSMWYELLALLTLAANAVISWNDR